MANKELLIKAAEKFIHKCDNGLARSKESYKMFKEALEASEECPHYFVDTDGVHCVFIGRCRHPKRFEWETEKEGE